MKIIGGEFMTNNAVNHPYESNPDYNAKINTFYYSDDEKLIAGYWEAPEGWFEAQIEEQNEINYVIDGEIDIICGEKKITAKKGDCFLVESGEKLKWVIKKHIKTIYFIYPANEEIAGFFKDLEKNKDI
jgi:ethanolamine utilization protein EutQ (cupin superfamily)